MKRHQGLSLILLSVALLPLGGCAGLERPPSLIEGLTRYPRAAFDIRWLDHNAIELNAARSTGSTGSRIVQYKWDFGDGKVARDGIHVVRHAYEQPGRYVISLTVYDERQQTASAKRVVTVVPEGEIPFEVIVEGYRMLWGREHTVALAARNLAELQRIWFELFGSLEVYNGPPQLDFTQEMVIALAGGWAFSRFRVDSLRIQGSRLQIVYTEIQRVYGPRCVLPLEAARPAVWPLVVLVTKRVDLPIDYVRRTQKEYIFC